MVSAGPLRLSGFTGWLVWLFIHIGFLTGYRNRVGAVLTWLLAFTRDLRRERAYTTRSVGIMQDLYAQLPDAPGPADQLPTSPARSGPMPGKLMMARPTQAQAKQNRAPDDQAPGGPVPGRVAFPDRRRSAPPRQASRASRAGPGWRQQRPPTAPLTRQRRRRRAVVEPSASPACTS